MEKTKVLITKDKIQAYEDCRSSGVTNMFHVTNVCFITGLLREEVMEIMNNYSKYMEEFKIERS